VGCIRLALYCNKITKISQHIPISMRILGVKMLDGYSEKEISDFTRSYDIYNLLAKHKIHYVSNIIKKYLSFPDLIPV